MKRSTYLFFLLFLAFLSACTKDFLNVNNTQQLFRESYIKDLTSMEEYLRGTTFTIGRFIESGETLVTYTELVADNLRPVSTTSSTSTFPIYNWMQSSLGGPNMNALWSNSYQTIKMCNFVVDNVDKYKNENPSKASDIKGQALAIRALLYFKLVNVFSQSYVFTTDASHPGVPYVVTSNVTESYSRQSVAKVYDAIISDLKNAIELLPVSITDIRYMNRNAAKALLARTYLFKEDYANAKTVALEVADQVPLLTIAGGYPNDIFKFKSPSSTEVLFQLVPHPSSNFLGRYVRRSPIIYLATNDIAGILTENAGDIRKIWVNKVSSNWNIVKFPSGVAPEANPVVTTAENAYYPPMLRSSEMFLTVAEAAAKTNDEHTAKVYLNAIRKRANPSSIDVTASGAALLDSIYNERRKELAFEGLRMFDLQRLKNGVFRTDVLPGSPARLPFPSEKTVSPIPESETRLSGLSQNSGY